VHYRVIERVVDRTNDDIRQARQLPSEDRRAAALARLHDPGTIADRIRHEFGPGFLEMRTLEEVLYSHAMQEQFPEKLTAYRTPLWIYFHTHLPIDPRKLVLFFQASTIRVYGVYFGTDKFGHFHDLGHFYFKDFLRHRAAGMSDDEAREKIARAYSQGVISEGAMIGLWATGVYSNADLASNYAGFKFYQNLTEPTYVDGRTRPPMLVQIGEFWAMNTHIRPDAPLLKPFISDHWNEALNPSLYEWGMRGTIAKQLRNNAEDIVTFYCDLDGRPRSPGYFDALADELSSWFGEDYGHSGIDERILTIGNTCLPAIKEQEGSDPQPDPDLAAADSLADSSAY